MRAGAVNRDSELLESYTVVIIKVQHQLSCELFADSIPFPLNGDLVMQDCPIQIEFNFCDSNIVTCTCLYLNQLRSVMVDFGTDTSAPYQIKWNTKQLANAATATFCDWVQRLCRISSRMVQPIDLSSARVFSEAEPDSQTSLPEAFLISAALRCSNLFNASLKPFV